MSGSTCGLSRPDALGSVSGNNISLQLLCHSKPHRPHKLTGSTPIFSHRRHGPVAMTSAREATMSNIAVQMRHSSRTVLDSYKRTTLVMCMPMYGCGPPCVWTTLDLCDGTAQRMSPHPCCRGTRTCPWSAAHSPNALSLRTSGRGRSCSALHPEPNHKAMVHSLTRIGPNGRDANSLASINSVHLRSAALAHSNASSERDSTAGSGAAHCQST